MAYKFVSKGNIYWRVQINLKGIKVSKLFHSAKDANRFEHETREAIKDGTYVDADFKKRLTPSIADILSDYLTLVLNHKNKDFVAFEQTRKAQEHKLLKTIPNVPIYIWDNIVYHKEYQYEGKYDIETESVPFGMFKITSVDRAVIEAYIERRKLDGLKEGSIRTELTLVKSAYHYAKNKLYPHLKADGIIIENPFEDFIKSELPKHSPPRKNIVTQEQIKMAIEFFSKPTRRQYLLAFKIALQTGLRKSETLSIKFSNCKKVDNGAVIHIPISKNGKPRDVFIDDETYALIEKQKEDRIFRISISALNETWRRCWVHYGVKPNPIWHTLKNTAITEAIKSQQNSSYVLAERFSMRVDDLEKIKGQINQEQLIIKLQKGEKLTDKEISFLIGGHSSMGMTQHYFVDEVKA